MSFAEYLKKHHPNFDPVTLARQTSQARDTLSAWLAGMQKPAECETLRQVADALKLALKEKNALLRAAGLQRCVFADLLRRYKNRHGSNDQHLEKLSGASRQNLNRWQNEICLPASREQVIRLAEALNLSNSERAEFISAAGYEDILSPCVVGRPVTHIEQFIGRQGELSRIIEQWKRMPLQHIAVIGPKGSGKTSLLYRLGQRGCGTSKLGRQIMVDFKDPRLCQRERLLRYLAQNLELPVPEGQFDTFKAFDILHQYRGEPAFILLDDLEIGLQAPELDMGFWGGLRALTQTPDSRLGFLLTARQLPEYAALEHGKPSPFFNVFAHLLELTPWNEAEIARYFETVSLLDGRNLSEDDKSWLADRGGGWPNRLQLLTDCYLKGLSSPYKGESWQVRCLEHMARFCGGEMT